MRKFASSDFRFVSFVRVIVYKPQVRTVYETYLYFPSVFLWSLCNYYPVLKIDDRKVNIIEFQIWALRQRLGEDALDDRALTLETVRKLQSSGTIVKCCSYCEERCMLRLRDFDGSLTQLFPDVVAVIRDVEYVFECHAFRLDLQEQLRKFSLYILNNVRLWVVVNNCELAVEQVLQRIAITVFELLRDVNVKYTFRISKVNELLDYTEYTIVNNVD